MQVWQEHKPARGRYARAPGRNAAQPECPEPHPLSTLTDHGRRELYIQIFYG
jgi:hypothetical protein